MPHHRLVPVGRHDSYADEIILSRNEDTGEVEHRLSIHDVHEIPEELLEEAHDLAGRVGLRVVEADAPEEEAESEGQEPGADTASGSPVVKQTGESTSEIDQQAQAGRAAQQDSADAGASGGPATTTGGGTPASGATSAPGAAGTAGTSGTTPSTTNQ